MIDISSYALQGIRGLEIWDDITEIFDPTLLIFSSIFNNRNIVHDIRGLILINKVHIRFYGLPQHTSVFLRIISAIWRGNKQVHEHKSLNQQKLGTDMQQGYDQYYGAQ